MARQSGLLKFEGKIGDLIFYKGEDGDYYVRTKGTLDKDRIANDPSFARTRENNREFGQATKVSSLIRRAFAPHVIKDRLFFARLSKIALSIIKQDSVNARGGRELIEGDTNNFYDYHFAGSDGVFNATITETYDRVAGTVDYEVGAYTPAVDVLSPVGATHFRYEFVAAEIDLANDTYIRSVATGAYIDEGLNTPVAIDNLSLSLSPSSPHLVLGVMTLRFYQFISGVYYPFAQDDFSILSLVAMP